MTPRSRVNARKEKSPPKYPERRDLIPKPTLPPPKPIGPKANFSLSGCKYIHGHPGSDWQTCGHPISPLSRVYCQYHLELAEPHRKAS